MLVPQSIKLTIITADGKKCELSAEPTAGVHFIKRRAIEAIYSSECDGQEPLSVKKALYFKLIHPGQLKTLKDESTLLEEQISTDCELLLVKKRLDESRFSRYGAAANRDKNFGKPPDAHSINEATARLPPRGKKFKHEEENTPDFQHMLRRILITLVESAQNILALDPEASKIFREAQEIMTQEAVEPTNTNRQLPSPDELLVKQLTDMGFDRDKSIAALKLTRSLNGAMEILLTNPDSLVVEPPTSSQPPISSQPSISSQPPISSQPSTSSQTSHTQPSVSQPESEVSQPESSGEPDVRSRNPKPVSTTDACSKKPQCKAQTLLESFRAYKRRKFKPNEYALTMLIDMGFEESDVLEALRITENDQEAACDWLLRTRGQAGHSTEPIEEGIDTASPLYQAIITNPIVQLGLNNPRSLLAFLHMLENGASAMDWFKDPDVGPLLLQISRTYAAERPVGSYSQFADSAADS